MPRNIIIALTPNEVNQSLIQEGDPAVYRLLPKNHRPVEGKTAYTELLCNKMQAATPAGSSFKLRNGFRATGADGSKFALYAKCDHGVQHPVSYLVADLGPDRPLNMVFTIKCDRCLLVEEQHLPVAAEQPQQNVVVEPPVPAPAPAPIIIPQVGDDLRSSYDRAGLAMGQVLNEAYLAAINAPNPQAHVQLSLEAVGERIKQAYINALRREDAVVVPILLSPPRASLSNEEEILQAAREFEEREREERQQQQRPQKYNFSKRAQAEITNQQINIGANSTRSAAKRGRHV
ncbi:hypothetical protein PVAND_011523 [Polypedilum vanderplanki]|uniref:Uncharacterized protein n=1 Tax=Polypedilum vanderplanki TaxID=319348 RepID=A0A9J6CJV5_POLVA|nr:hypothetical protein PVAND_011523 [Polypedilum vanderplanki]